LPIKEKAETEKNLKFLRTFISGVNSQIWRNFSATDDHLPLWLQHKIAQKKKKKRKKKKPGSQEEKQTTKRKRCLFFLKTFIYGFITKFG
jgi:hypothetical protein